MIYTIIFLENYTFIYILIIRYRHTFPPSFEVYIAFFIVSSNSWKSTHLYSIYVGVFQINRCYDDMPIIVLTSILIRFYEIIWYTTIYIFEAVIDNNYCKCSFFPDICHWYTIIQRYWEWVEDDVSIRSTWLLKQSPEIKLAWPYLPFVGYSRPYLLLSATPGLPNFFFFLIICCASDEFHS